MLLTCPRTIFHDSDSQLPQSKSLALCGRDEVDRHLRNLARHVRAFCFDACHDGLYRSRSTVPCSSWVAEVIRRIVRRATAFEVGQLNQNGSVSIIFGPRIRKNHSSSTLRLDQRQHCSFLPQALVRFHHTQRLLNNLCFLTCLRLPSSLVLSRLIAMRLPLRLRPNPAPYPPSDITRTP